VLKCEVDALKALDNVEKDFFCKEMLEMPGAERVDFCSSTMYDVGDSVEGSSNQVSETC